MSWGLIWDRKRQEGRASVPGGQQALRGSEMSRGLEIHIGDFGAGAAAPPVDGVRRKGSRHSNPRELWNLGAGIGRGAQHGGPGEIREGAEPASCGRAKEQISNI